MINNILHLTVNCVQQCVAYINICYSASNKTKQTAGESVSKPCSWMQKLYMVSIPFWKLTNNKYNRRDLHLILFYETIVMLKSRNRIITLCCLFVLVNTYIYRHFVLPYDAKLNKKHKTSLFTKHVPGNLHIKSKWSSRIIIEKYVFSVSICSHT